MVLRSASRAKRRTKRRLRPSYLVRVGGRGSVRVRVRARVEAVVQVYARLVGLVERGYGGRGP